MQREGSAVAEECWRAAVSVALSCFSPHWCHYHGVDSGGRAAAAGLRSELTLPPAGAAANTAPNPAPPLPPLSGCRSPCSCAWLTASCLHWSSPRCCM
jgi:hypothetical protein